jgi:hypothetical protein
MSGALSQSIKQHYTRPELGTSILGALATAGKNIDNLSRKILHRSMNFTSAVGKRHSSLPPPQGWIGANAFWMSASEGRCAASRASSGAGSQALTSLMNIVASLRY